MSNNKPCPICDLGEEACNEVARRFSIGLPASEVVGWLGQRGLKATQRDLINHRRHVTDLKPPTVAPFVQTEPDRPARPSMSEPGLSDRDREERLLTGFLAATERLLADFEETGSIKIARTAAELGKVTAALLNSKIERVEEPDPVINIIVNRQRLEDII